MSRPVTAACTTAFLQYVTPQTAVGQLYQLIGHGYMHDLLQYNFEHLQNIYQELSVCVFCMSIFIFLTPSMSYKFL